MAALAIGDGGALGWIDPDTVEFPDEAQPTLCTMQLFYKVSGGGARVAIPFTTDTTATQANIRSAMKDAIKADILTTFGVDIPKSASKTSNSLE